MRRKLMGRLLLAASLLAPVGALTAQARPAPFLVGEELTFKAHFGVLSAGTARMRVEAIDTVRGREAYRISFAIDGGIIGFRIHDRYESWMDVETLSSLRHKQDISEGRYRRKTTYEIYPEIGKYRKNDDSLETSVENPLDDGSFVYAVRAMAIGVGDTLRVDRYFRPDRNPVVLIGDRREEVTVRMGMFKSIVVRPKIHANGIFGENGDAEIWFTDDARRLPVRIKSHFAKFSLNLSLESYNPGYVASR
jgi:Protein of unknown function (DUF3108)